MPEYVTLKFERAVADDLLMRLLESRSHDGDAHECYLIVRLADALGEGVSVWMRKRAAIFCDTHVPGARP